MKDLSKNEDSRPLLEASGDDAGKEMDSNTRSELHHDTTRSEKSSWSSIFLSTFLGINMIMLLVNWRWWHATRHASSHIALDSATKFYSPVNGFLEHETISMNYSHESVFAGKPRPELDAAWYDLLYYTKIVVTSEEMRAANISTLKLKGENKYMAYLEVNHQLHCLKRLVQMRYPEYYSSYVERGMLTEEHFDHCVEVIRKGLMCNANTHLHSYAYDTTRPGNLASKSSGQRTCVKWDSITNWAKERFAGEDYEIDLEHANDALGSTY